MLFNVTNDEGSFITGYFVPDGFSENPIISVCDNNIEIMRLNCEIYNSGVFELNRHETGYVNFHLSDADIPGLAHRADISLHDADTKLLLYRRFNPNIHIAKQVLRVETQFVPTIKLDKAVKSYFSYYLPQIDNLGAETILQLIHLTHFSSENYSSTYLSGRLQVKNYEQFIDSNFLSYIILNDPYFEFTMRLLVISLAKTGNLNVINDRDMLYYKDAIEYFSEIDIHDENSVIKYMKSAPKEVLKLFHSPVTRQLVCKTSEETVNYKSAGEALQMLSRFDQVYLYDQGNMITRGVSELLNIAIPDIDFKLKEGILSRLMQLIKTLPKIDSILESDLILYHYVQDAMKSIDHDTPAIGQL